MANLSQILAAHAPLLLLDAASTHVQVGWLEPGKSARWASADDEAGVAVFRAIAQLGVAPPTAGALIFCEGPGSILGIRTTAIALRTWCVLQPRPVFSYSSLAVVAQALGRPETAVIADARRDSWHRCQLGRGLSRVATADLAGELVMPDGFRHWTPLPATVTRVPYDLSSLLPRVMEADLFQASDAPDAFLHEEPSYVTWTPQIHRAPVD